MNMNGNMSHSNFQPKPMVATVTNHIGEVLLTQLKKDYAEHGSFSLKKLSSQFPSIGKHKIGGHIGRLARDKFVSKQDGSNDIYRFLRPLDNVKLRMTPLRRNVPEEPMSEAEQVFAKKPETAPQIETKPAAESIQTAPPSPVPALPTAPAMEGKLIPAFSMSDISERLMALAVEAEKATPNLHLISNEDLFAELQRRMK